jgi:predicted ribosome quality control (RQC) complex YloA/Tae2 family protein
VVEQRLDVAKVEAEKAALSRLDKIRSDQTQRAAALEAEAAAAELRASLIEYNLEAVDAALAAVNGVVASGMSWGEIEALIKEERRSGNPVAGLIHSLQLDQNRVTLLLSNNLDEDDEVRGWWPWLPGAGW